jgi:hypothetical protein
MIMSPKRCRDEDSDNGLNWLEDDGMAKAETKTVTSNTQKPTKTPSQGVRISFLRRRVQSLEDCVGSVKIALRYSIDHVVKGKLHIAYEPQ